MIGDDDSRAAGTKDAKLPKGERVGQQRAPEVEMHEVEGGERLPQQTRPPALESQPPDPGRPEQHIGLIAECARGIRRADACEAKLPFRARERRGVAADEIGHVQDA